MKPNENINDGDIMEFLYNLQFLLRPIQKITPVIENNCLITRKYMGEECLSISIIYFSAIEDTVTNSFSLYCHDSLNLSLSMTPPVREKVAFKKRLHQCCAQHGIRVDGYTFTVTKPYTDIRSVVNSDITGHANDLLYLYGKMRDIRAQIL